MHTLWQTHDEQYSAM